MGDSQPLEEQPEFPLMMEAPMMPEMVFAPLAMPPLPEIEPAEFLLTAEIEEARRPVEGGEGTSEDVAQRCETVSIPTAPICQLNTAQVLAVIGALMSEGLVASMDVLAQRLATDQTAVEQAVGQLQREGLVRPGNYVGWVELTARGRIAMRDPSEGPRVDEAAGRATKSADGAVKGRLARWFFRKS